MTCTPSAFPRSVLAEASRISPRRRTSSDGICGDARHAAENSDHNPDSRGIPHAVDISQSTPGAPFWLPTYGIFDAHTYGFAIAGRMRAGVETRVKYLVSFLAGHDVIFDPAVSMTWRPNATGTEHASHLHVSFTDAAENSTAPFFLASGAPKVAVTPRYNPPFDIPGNVCDYILDPAGGRGVYVLGGAGGLYAFGAPACAGMEGNPAFAGRSGARLLAPNAQQRAAGKLVVIEDTAGETYACPPS